MSGRKRGFGFIGGAKFVPLLLVAGVMAGGSYAFTASNTVSAAPAGEGESAAFSGYAATNTKWTLDATDPTRITKVEFDLSPVTSSTTVYAGADNGTTVSWTGQCSSSGGGHDHESSGGSGSGHFTCSFASEPSVSATTKLAVSAAN